MLAPSMASTTWRALGTYVYVATAAPDHLDDVAAVTRDVLAAVDRTCSRFRDDSDLRRVNARSGRWVDVDQVLVGAMSTAIQVAHNTDGIVDPLLGRAMVSLGYDRDFAALTPQPSAPVAASPGAWRDIEISPTAVRIPEGTALDLGSIGKAWASDLVIATLAGLDADVQALVSVGGDIAATAGHWPVAISEHPDGPVAQTVWIDGGGLATSSTTVRRWSSAGAMRHHVLDPRTGQPAREVWRTVTVTGPSATAANAATTTAIVLGDAAVDWLTKREVPARLVDLNGAVTTTGGWPAEED